MSWDNDQNQQRKRANDRYRKALDNGKLDVFGMRLWEPAPEVVDTPPKRRRNPKKAQVIDTPKNEGIDPVAGRAVLLPRRSGKKALSEMIYEGGAALLPRGSEKEALLKTVSNMGLNVEKYRSLMLGSWGPDPPEDTDVIEVPPPIVELKTEKPKRVELTSSELRKNRAINLD